MVVLPVNAPAWMQIAARELGVHELDGKEFHPRIREYFAATSLKPSDDAVAWCSAFANWCMKRAGRAGTGSAAARSWLKWGEPSAAPKFGDVLVFWREKKTGPLGHVGFYFGEAGDFFLVLGGNQKNAVSIDHYPKSRLLEARQ